MYIVSDDSGATVETFGWLTDREIEDINDVLPEGWVMEHV